MTSAKVFDRLGATVIYTVLFAGAILVLVPFYWTMITAIKIPSETITYPIIWIPSRSLLSISVKPGKPTSTSTIAIRPSLQLLC